MKKQERMNQLLRILEQENGVSIRSLAKRLDYTEMTIRRDVRQLSDQGIVKLVSGAVMLDHMSTEAVGAYNLAYQKTKQLQEKQQIGKLAETLIANGDVVFFDIGTTTASIIPQLAQDKEITAICCTMNSLLEIYKKGIQNFLVTGGRYSPNLQMFESAEGVELLEKTRITKAFISAAGVHSDLGVTCVGAQEVDLKRAAIANAREKILVVDSSKFDQVSPSFVANIDEFDGVVTDHGVSATWVKWFEERGIPLLGF